MLRAYFDESGTHGEAHVTSIAGYVAAKSVWENVETEWDKEMSYYRERTAVRTFHLTDCLAGRGEFTGLDEFFRLAITSQLSRVLGRHEYNIAEKLTRSRKSSPGRRAETNMSQSIGISQPPMPA
jgi:hypothetical protein